MTLIKFPSPINYFKKHILENYIFKKPIKLGVIKIWYAIRINPTKNKK